MITIEEDVLLKEVINILYEIQDETGEKKVDINKNTKPFEDLPNFDSLRCVTFISILCNNLEQELNANKILFTLPNINPTIDQIVKTIKKFLVKEDNKDGKYSK